MPAKTKTKPSKTKSLVGLKKHSYLKIPNYLSHSRFSKANLTIFILIFAAIGGYVLLQSRAVAPMANIWVTPQGLANGAGSECVWHDIPVVAPTDPTQACGDLQAANLVAPAAPPAGSVVLITGDSSTPYVPTGYTSNGADYTSGPPPSTGCSHTPGASNICMVENACRSITGNNHTAPLIFKPAPTSNPVFTCQQILNTTYVQFADDDSGDLSAGPGNLRLGGLFTGGDHNSVTNVDITCQDSAPYPLTSGTQASSSTGPGANTTGQFCSAFIKGTMTNFTMTNGSIGPTYVDSCGTNGENASWDNSIGYSLSAAHIVFDHVDSHNPRFGINPVGGQVAGYTGGCTGNGGDGTTAAQAHAENFYLTDVTDVTIKNMYFKTCGNSTGVFVTRQSSKVDSHQSNQVNFINNIFQGSGAGTSCGVDLGYTNNALLAYNDFPSGGYIFCNGCDTSLGNSATLVGNILYGNVCPQVSASWSFTFSHNLWMFNTSSGGSASNCGGVANGDQAYNPSHDPGLDLWVNKLIGDFHLKAPPNPAIDGGDPGNYSLASPDFYNQNRYLGAGPDIGAAEFNPVAAGMANLWVDTSGGSCSRAVNPTSYTDLTACNNMQAAMTAAEAGDIVIIKNGTYPGQTIISGTKASAVSFYAETPSQVSLTGNLNLDGVDRIHIYGVISAGSGETRSGLDICDTNCKGFTTQDILIDGFAGKAAFIRATNVIIDHSEFGAFSACNAANSEDGFRFWDGTGGSGTPTNSVIRNSKIHDVDAGVGDSCQGTSHAGWHIDCMQNNGGDHLTIENNIFYNCPTSNIQDDPFGGAHTNNIIVQNNFFGPAHCCNSVALGYQGSTVNFDCSTLEVRYNIFDGGGVNPNDCGSGSLGVKVYGNIFATNIFACNAGLNYSYNIFHPIDGPTCGTNIKRCAPIWEAALPAWGGSLPNPHLASSDTCAKGAGDPANYPTTDIDGNIRTSPPTAGADEYVLGTTTVAKPGDINSDSHVNILDLSILLSHYGQVATSSQGDLTGDGRVSILDLSILLSHYGS